eukprot:TRINITY_DN7876_c0_g1_i1.p1 TRINITY_DN7876_c0_g1~~TRINITY_DN7876_c0_g1_i1.p1  ORF type:complete len:262 (+),score=38.37 TRINITY_DN7876_c0_g1_i1:309-1094(+)
MIQRISQGIPDLKEIDVSYCSGIRDFLCCFPNLISFKCANTNISDPSLSSILTFSSFTLEVLDISNCIELTSLSIECMADIDVHLRELKISGNKSFSQSALDKLIGSIGENISVLDCSDCVIQDIFSDNLSIYCNGLTTLNISGCWTLSDETIAFMISQLPLLIKLYLSNLTFLSDLTLFSIASHLSELKTLACKSCLSIQRSGLLEISSKIHTLKKLFLDDVVACDDTVILRLSQNCPDLKVSFPFSLIIRFCLFQNVSI